jgi:hypothetical protein
MTADPIESLFRPGLSAEDFVVTVTGEQCNNVLELANGHRHYFTRIAGHEGQHYSFSGEPSYEVVWPATT